MLLIKFPNGFPQGQLIFNFDATPRAITGIQKVAQMFFKILFTTKGSNLLFPNQGTNFSALTVNSNLLSNDAVFMSDLRAEVANAESQVKAILNTGTDTASQLNKITIMALDVVKDSATMMLRLSTMAGDLAQVSVPFPQTDLLISPTVQ
jgi:hypothetical protein